MNKTERMKAAERIKKAHDYTCWNPPSAIQFNAQESHNDCAELLTLLAGAERDNDELRAALRAVKCTDVAHQNTCAVTGYCDFCMMRDELLNKQESDNE